VRPKRTSESASSFSLRRLDLKKRSFAEHEANVDALRGVGVINCLLILLSLHDGNNGGSKRER